jgi:hypothetical protein
MTKYVWVYISRNGNHHVYTGDSVGFMKARAEQDDDNRITVEEIIAENDLEVGGSEESGHFYIDDGGDITLYEIE